eukprot:TRINITY_DN55503_c0_g1_i1.p1 TRINITY_DN55503_c0_g1~~TRINITY_DN55503_c0_g1_i1.p1  ORF type:complete len:455 (+),score=267.34 TRINITY_DN55503_c0_g1_i1:107-1366(+)
MMKNLQENSRVLVVGAGGLGCDLLKNLALSGFQDIYLIDLDTIDISNLNRQFLFRKTDIGKPKAQVAADFIMKRCPSVKVKWFQKKIQEFSPKWYKDFDVVVAGLDNVEARRWLNRTLNELVEFDEDGDPIFETIIPLIDGGTEGFRGQSRVFYPKISSCFECSLDSMPPGNHYHLCTIANVPRIPQHCIQYVYEIMWPLLEEFNSVDDYKLYEQKDGDDYVPAKVKLDKDDAQHMSWIYQRSLERAKQFGIEGVTYKLTMQVVKNIIPAIASTNAIVAAQCTMEAVKCVTFCSMILNNFMQYNGVNLAGCLLHEYEKKPNCSVCQPPAVVRMQSSDKVSALLALLESDKYGFEQPSLTGNDKVVYIATLHSAYEGNLDKPLSDFFEHSKLIQVSDKNKKSNSCLLIFEDQMMDEADDE